MAGRGLAHGSGLDPKPKVFKYIIPNEGADRWLWRLRRAANHRYSAKEKNASGITVIRETYAVFRGVSGMTTCITDIQLPPSRKKGEDVQVDVIEGVETIRQEIFEQTLATYTGDSNEGIEDVHGNQFPHAVRGSVRTSRNIHIDAEEILRLASKSVWVLVERNTVSAKDAEAVIADLGIQIKEVSDGGQLAISSVTTAAIDDPQVMQSLWEAVRYGSGYNTRLAVQRTPPRMDDSIDDLFEEEVA